MITLNEYIDILKDENQSLKDENQALKLQIIELQKTLRNYTIVLNEVRDDIEKLKKELVNGQR